MHVKAATKRPPDGPLDGPLDTASGEAKGEAKRVEHRGRWAKAHLVFVAVIWFLLLSFGFCCRHLVFVIIIWFLLPSSLSHHYVHRMIDSVFQK